MEEFDKDILSNLFNELNNQVSNELTVTEEELKNNISKVNMFLKDIEKRIKLAEEEGDEALYNLELNRKQIILQKLQELEEISNKIKIKRG